MNALETLRGEFMIFEQNEKELLLKLITIEQSRLVVQCEEEGKNDNLINTYEIIKKKIKRI